MASPFPPASADLAAPADRVPGPDRGDVGLRPASRGGGDFRSPGLLFLGVTALVVGYVRLGWLSSTPGPGPGSATSGLLGCAALGAVAALVLLPGRRGRLRGPRTLGWAVAGQVLVAVLSAATGSPPLATAAGAAALVVAGLAFTAVARREVTAPPGCAAPRPATDRAASARPPATDGATVDQATVDQATADAAPRWRPSVVGAAGTVPADGPVGAPERAGTADVIGLPRGVTGARRPRSQARRVGGVDGRRRPRPSMPSHRQAARL